MEFIEGVIQLILSPGGTYQGDDSYPLAVFAAASGIMGSIVVILDWIMFQANKGSALKLTYRGLNVIGLLLLWGTGAGLAGFLGASFGILELNRAASITVGVGWPLVLPRLLKSIETEPEDVENFAEVTE